MKEELGYEVTPKQSLDGLWKTMHKYIEHHGYSDISLEIEGSQYEFREHLKKYDEYEAKAKAFDEIFKLYIGYEDGWIHFPRGSKSFNKEIISVCKEYERGEYDD